MTFCEMYKSDGCHECPNRYVCQKDINTVRKHFLLMVAGLTGASKNDIKILFFEHDFEGRFKGTIEIDGQVESVNEYHC